MTEEKKPKTVLEVVEYETNEVVETIDLTKHSPRNRDKIERGMNINLNHAEYFTRVTTEGEGEDG